MRGGSERASELSNEPENAILRSSSEASLSVEKWEGYPNDAQGAIVWSSGIVIFLRIACLLLPIH